MTISMTYPPPLNEREIASSSEGEKKIREEISEGAGRCADIYPRVVFDERWAIGGKVTIHRIISSIIVALVKNQAQDTRHKSTDSVAFWDVLSGIWGSLGFCNLVFKFGQSVAGVRTWLHTSKQGIKAHPKWSVEPGENGKIFGDFNPLSTRSSPGMVTCFVGDFFGYRVTMAH
ncbi:hypothetical protein B0H14DRAFT_2566543 [Mycena olivaceomarginata]|nr:hypothetical protein B0H14DRAFT_2566543 [Mycena olivaceomarginata]